MDTSGTVTNLIQRGDALARAGNAAAAERAYCRAAAHLRRAGRPARRVSRRLVRALTQAGDLRQQQGRYREAERLLLEAIAVAERAFGATHLEVSAPLNNLAVCYKYLARFAEAGPLYQRALAISEEALGPDHPEVATVYHNLGGLEHAAGNWLRGEPFARKAVRIRRRALGPDHPDVAADLTALAALLDRQEKYAEAERLYRRALRIVERVHGPEHHTVAVNLNNLAAIYQARGRVKAAEQMYRRALDIDTRCLGEGHPKVAYCTNNLAVLLMARRPREAASLFERALALFRRTLGPAHPNVGVCLENYGAVLERLGRTKEADVCARRAERILAKVDAVNDEAVGLTGTLNPDHLGFRMVVRPSPIHRLGVFADEPIPPHRKVIEYTGERISRRESKRRWNPKRSYLFLLDSYWTIDGAIGGSGAEYINHSCAPNLKTRMLRGHILYFSTRRIEKGEELTVDYKYAADITRMPCSCGAPTCRGTMNVTRREARKARARRRGRP
jgi:tetratricopeptide (TPR) repeat protein